MSTFKQAREIWMDDRARLREQINEQFTQEQKDIIMDWARTEVALENLSRIEGDASSWGIKL